MGICQFPCQPLRFSLNRRVHYLRLLACLRGAFRLSGVYVPIFGLIPSFPILFLQRFPISAPSVFLSIVFAVEAIVGVLPCVVAGRARFSCWIYIRVHVFFQGLRECGVPPQWVHASFPGTTALLEPRWDPYRGLHVCLSAGVIVSPLCLLGSVLKNVCRFSMFALVVGDKHERCYGSISLVYSTPLTLLVIYSFERLSLSSVYKESQESSLGAFLRFFVLLVLSGATDKVPAEWFLDRFSRVSHLWL